MRPGILRWFFALGWLLAVNAFGDEVIKLRPGQKVKVKNTTIEVVNSPKVPIVTKECIHKSPSGRCDETNTIYSLKGLQCVEDCLKFDGAHECSVRNTCKYDEKSECFKKKVCVEFDSMGECSQWKLELIC